MTPAPDPTSRLWSRTVTRKLRDVAVGGWFRYGEQFREVYGKVHGTDGMRRRVLVELLDSGLVGGIRAAHLEPSLEVEIPYSPEPA